MISLVPPELAAAGFTCRGVAVQGEMIASCVGNRKSFNELEQYFV
jgi:hypothetical protein